MTKSQTASQAVKAAGFKNLKQVTELLGESPEGKILGESRQTLGNWFKNEPLRFELYLLGCAAKFLN